ncbi:3394_t:CDS:1, partial [Gigaspora rosea]
FILTLSKSFQNDKQFRITTFPSFYGHSKEPEHVLTSDNHPWMSTQYFKFKLITSESISVITNTFLQAMSPNNVQNNIRYEFIAATTRHIPYGRKGNKEMTIVMKTDRIINLPYVNSSNFADGFDIVHVSVNDLVDEKTALERPYHCVIFIPTVLICMLRTLHDIEVHSTNLSNIGTFK